MRNDSAGPPSCTAEADRPKGEGMKKNIRETLTARLEEQSAVFPARLAAAWVALSAGLVHLVQLLRQRDLYFINKFILGLDYRDFYQASTAVARGDTPYSVARYVTPPLPAILNLPFLAIPFEQARFIISGLVLVAVCVGYILTVDTFTGRDADRPELLLAGLTAILFSYPFYFLFDRGNVDGFVLLLLAGALLALRRFPVWAGLLFSFAIHVKLYPVLILPALLVVRQRRAALAAVLFTILLAAMTPAYTMDFVERLLSRGQQFRITENGSLACTFFYFAYFLDRLTPLHFKLPALVTGINTIAYAFFALTLAACFYLDHTALRHASAESSERTARLALYLPFMAAVPQLAYHYELVLLLLLLPVLSHLWGRVSAKGRWAIVLISIGVGLGQGQAVALEKLWRKVFPHLMPGFGLLLVLLGILLLKAQKWESPE